MFDKVLIANRGAIACRILRTLDRLGIASVAVYSDADRHARHVALAGASVRLGPAPAAQSYLQQDRIIQAALDSGAQAIHPGYGFLSENADFADQCQRAGIVFIGPTPAQMRDFGLKHTAREIARANEVPLLSGSGLLTDVSQAQRAADEVGYPVMLKSTAGGGGIGMQLCRTPHELTSAFDSVERLAQANFSQGGVFVEQYIQRARHIEVQIFGNGRGQVVALGERDCSVQRRHQKVIEETPAPGLSTNTRAQLLDCAQRLGRAVNYTSAGTVEFVYDAASGEFYFLEVNTRLQVEHGVTEQVTGIDLVEWMLRVAAGEPPELRNFVAQPRGHSIQVRIYAEDPAHQFRPCSGLLSQVQLPETTDTVRVDSWIETGTEVPAWYDPLLAKIIVFGATRAAALTNMDAALSSTQLHGIETNVPYLQAIVRDAVFREGRQYTRYLDSFNYCPLTIEVVQPGTHSIIQDVPGRIGYWSVGVPPSGPMDDLALRLANRILDNAENAAALELTVSGPSLLFHTATVIALTGAAMSAELDGVAVPYWTPIVVNAGSMLRLRSVQGAGQRTYLAVGGGFDVPMYMGSRATFTLGQFGGHAGRALRAGDILRLFGPSTLRPGMRTLTAASVPVYQKHWDIAVLYGPHAAPDFFTTADMDMFFGTDWEVHYNSSRTGVRLIGPKPLWARSDGGEAGLHPSNIHDNAYAIGAIDFTGDMPVILGPDGPSLGGFVCPATIARAHLWKIGQLRPGDTIRFHCIDMEQALQFERATTALIDSLGQTPAMARLSTQAPRHFTQHAAVLASVPASDTPAVCYRQSGDDNLLIEYGPLVLDLELRFRVYALMQWLAQQRVPGVLELTPGIRSLQVHFDPQLIPQRVLLDLLLVGERELPSPDHLEIPSRIVHLPLSWDDPSTRLAIGKYMQSVRRDAPWCPDNIEFIRRINGLDSVDEVRRIVFDASYLVMGLGDVYLGAPVATPLDPRHRLVTTKYNPARTWTPENAVGIGGAYLCVYGMEGPGGYQFVGRTVQMWNRYRQTTDFNEGRQWLLRFFDQLRFYPVSADELSQLREDFPHGKFALRIEPTTLRLSDYRQFLQVHDESIVQFKRRQQQAFDAERERWTANGQLTFEAAPTVSDAGEESRIAADATGLCAPVTGSIWQVAVAVGQDVQEGDELLVIEAMKMEIPVCAEVAGQVIEVRCERGTPVTAGDILIVVRSGSG